MPNNISGNVVDWSDHANVSYKWTLNGDGSSTGIPTYTDGTQVNDPRFPIRYLNPTSPPIRPTPTNVYANPGTAVVAPNAGQPITISGSANSTADPFSDENRKVNGQVPGTSVVFNNPG